MYIYTTRVINTYVCILTSYYTLFSLLLIEFCPVPELFNLLINTLYYIVILYNISSTIIKNV